MNVPIAQHILLEYQECDPKLMGQSENLIQILIAAVKDSGATYLKHQSHAFSPHGLTVMVLIAESHVAVHTWPEHQYVAMDIFTCSPSMNWGIIQEAMAQALGSGKVTRKIVARGY